MKKQCRNCFEFKSLDEFSLTKYENLFRTQCKKCRTEIETRRIMQKKKELFPNAYWECEFCDRIISNIKNFCVCGKIKNVTKT